MTTLVFGRDNGVYGRNSIRAIRPVLRKCPGRIGKATQISYPSLVTTGACRLRVCGSAYAGAIMILRSGSPLGNQVKNVRLMLMRMRRI